jgi:prepilin-type N-terminal cleavage/methylation domain-containing protein
LFRKRLNNESGYSLVEVIVSIIILSIAILPMAGMFDMGLRTATTGSNYDKARTLANLKMEQAKSLPFDSTDATNQDVKDNFPEAAATTTTYNGSGFYQSAWMTVSGPASADFTNFHYRVEKQYMVQPSQTPTSTSENFGPSSSATNLIRVTVIVGWGPYSSGNYSKTYTTFGLVTG